MSELSGARRAELLAYCRLGEPTEEDALLLPALYASAVGYMEGAGISEPEEGTARRAQYDLCIDAMVLDAYDRRDRTITNTVVIDNPAFRRMMTQLKLTEPVSAVGVGPAER